MKLNKNNGWIVMNNTASLIGYLNLFIAHKTQPQLKAELLSAIMHSRLGVVKNLVLYEHAPVNFITVSGVAPLGLAVYKGCMNIVKFLMDHGADADAQVWCGETVLTMIASDVLDRGNSWSDNERYDVLYACLSHGANLDTMNRDGYTPLHCAVIQQDEGIAYWLLSRGANPNSSQHVTGLTPLHIAAGNLDLRLAEELVEFGADWHIQSYDEHTPMDMALRSFDLGLEGYNQDAYHLIIEYFTALDPLPIEPELPPESELDLCPESPLAQEVELLPMFDTVPDVITIAD